MYFIVPFLFCFVICWAFVLLLSQGIIIFSKDKQILPPTDPAKIKLKADLMKKFSSRLADIAAGKGNTAQAKGELKNLRVSIDFALQNTSQALEMVLHGLSKLNSPVGQSSAATSIFGSALSARLMTEWNKTRVPMSGHTNRRTLASKTPFIVLPNGSYIPLEEHEVNQALRDKYKIVYR